jgi:crotonobetainyl-CoA:carnitine CoA-transferase CaiB-like acyl-CoA transferase
MAERLLRSYGLEHLLEDARFADNGARVTHTRELDEEVAGAIASRTLEENVAIIEANHLTAVPVQTIADIESDPHWQARGLTLDVPNGAGGVRMHNVVPRLSETPGAIRWAGGDLGQDNPTLYGELGLSPDEQQRLRASGVI